VTVPLTGTGARTAADKDAGPTVTIVEGDYRSDDGRGWDWSRRRALTEINAAHLSLITTQTR
jgi:hypothetical protein